MKQDRKQEICNIVEHIVTNYNYGDTIQYKQLERLIGMSMEEIGFMYMMTAVKKELAELGVVLTSVIGEGYRILFPNEIAREVYRKYVKAGVRKFRAGLMIMSNIDQNQLTKEEKEEFLAMEKIVANAQRSSENYLIEAQVLLGEVKKKELNK